MNADPQRPHGYWPVAWETRDLWLRLVRCFRCSRYTASSVTPCEARINPRRTSIIRAAQILVEDRLRPVNQIGLSSRNELTFRTVDGRGSRPQRRSNTNRESPNTSRPKRVGGVRVARRVLSVLCALISAWRSWVFETGRSGCEHLPLGQGGRAAQLVGLAVNEVAFG